MRYYIIAGEASGDLHGSNLIKSIRELDTNAHIRCWGGDLMQAAGAELVKHYRDLAFMGFVEVLMNLRTILRNLSFCKNDILEYKPDAIILIDYPGFNLRVAKWAKSQGIKVIYYISPQVWAWKESRVKGIKQHVDKMLVILPFEKDFYRKWNYEVEYVGHPLLEVVERFKNNAASQTQEAPPAGSLTSAGKPVIALLPGSRKQEILKKLPVMLETSKSFIDYEFVVAKAPGIEEDFYQSMLSNYPGVKTTSGGTYRLLNIAKAALVTSGTATLETALFKVPQVVCYKGSSISYHIAKRLIKVKYISLVNLIMDKEVVKELIQHEFTVENCETELRKLLFNPEKQKQVQNDYHQLYSLLNQGGHASKQAATSIVTWMRGR